MVTLRYALLDLRRWAHLLLGERNERQYREKKAAAIRHRECAERHAGRARQISAEMQAAYERRGR